MRRGGKKIPCLLRSQILFGNALAEAISLPIFMPVYLLKLARNENSRLTGGVPKYNLGTREPRRRPQVDGHQKNAFGRRGPVYGNSQ
jgi:hypothetical protein